MGLCLDLLLLSCKAWNGFSGHNKAWSCFLCTDVLTSSTGEMAAQVYLSPLLQKASSSLNSLSQKNTGMVIFSKDCLIILSYKKGSIKRLKFWLL